MILFATYSIYGQGIDLQQNVSIRFQNLTVEESISLLKKTFSLTFAYTNATVNVPKRINGSLVNESLESVLEFVFKDSQIKYLIYSEQIILIKEKTTANKFKIAGKIIEVDKTTPIPYSTVFIQSKSIGTVADINGRFEFGLTSENLHDTLTFSSLGYQSGSIRVDKFIEKSYPLICLRKDTIKIPEVKINSKDFKSFKLGNTGNMPSGSLYMDTHGQQAALFLDNQKRHTGILQSISFYLSSKGNIEAPFRVRIYSVDPATGGPGIDLLKGILVVKPNVKRGWFKINIYNFHIIIPEEGFFIAMEGIYPNDYDFYYQNSEFTKITTNEKSEPESEDEMKITYGQRIGFNKNKKTRNNTWHYSLSKIWFQLNKQPFALMISADIFSRRNNKNDEL